MPNTFDRITQDPNVLAGRATIRGLRISVAHVINLVANRMTPAQIVEELPELEEEDIRQALAYAAVLAQNEIQRLDNLTDQQRDWVLHSEALWREAHAIAAANPGVDPGDLYHALRCLELPPAQRLGRGLSRVRTRPHLG